MEFSRRQTNLFECLPFTPLHDANQPFKTINDRQEKRASSSCEAFSHMNKKLHNNIYGYERQQFKKLMLVDNRPTGRRI